jgi:hypothetical protein
MTVYTRTRAQKQNDFLEAREYEEYLESRLGVACDSRFDSTTELDIWVPGYMIEAKEKKQKYTKRWQLLEGVLEENLFIIDELTIRRALGEWPGAFFLLRDTVYPSGPRLFLAPIWELISVERVRVNRDKKGKWIIDTTNFRQVRDESEIPIIATHLLIEKAWKRSECLGGEVGQV